MFPVRYVLNVYINLLRNSVKLSSVQTLTLHTEYRTEKEHCGKRGKSRKRIKSTN
jgi:hypothetical protein